MKNSKGILTGFAATLWMFMGTHAISQEMPAPTSAPSETMKPTEETRDQMGDMEARQQSVPQTENAPVLAAIGLGKIQTVDTRVTFDSSLAFSPEGQPAISYSHEYDASCSCLSQDAGPVQRFDKCPAGCGALKYAVYNGKSWVISTVDVGHEPSLVFSPGGQPAISYTAPAWRAQLLKYAAYNGKSWTLSTVDRTQTGGEFSSLAFSPEGQPAISYWSWDRSSLQYAIYNGKSWALSSVSSLSNGWLSSVGHSTSLAFSPEGQPAISYLQEVARLAPHGAKDAHKFAIYDREYGWQLSIIDSVNFAGDFSSLAFSPGGQPAIAYRHVSGRYDNSNLKYALYNGESWDLSTVDSSGAVGQGDISLAFGPGGQPAISYFGLSSGASTSASEFPIDHHTSYGDLKIALYSGDSWVIRTVDSQVYSGFGTTSSSLAFSPEGQPAISYEANGDLRYALLPSGLHTDQ